MYQVNPEIVHRWLDKFQGPWSFEDQETQDLIKEFLGSGSDHLKDYWSGNLPGNKEEG